MLRALSEEDIPQLALIEQASQISPWLEETFNKCLQIGSKGWVMEVEGTVVGFILILMQMSEVHILNFCVHPEFQHHGFGQQLLEYTIFAAQKQNIAIAYLEVRRSNQNAIALYKKMGFQPIAERKSYYSTPLGREDAIVFAKQLRFA